MASLAAARADNFYYPPEWTPKQGSLNKFHGQHALRERARKLDQGILIISSVGDGSNAILLPGKKKSDSKHMRKEEKEKEKKALLSKSIHILEKCKIQDDVYSLLRPLGTICQAESMREKRCRAMQFSKAGLEVPEGALPFKKKKSRQNATCGNEIAARSDSGQNCFENDSGDYAPPPLKLIEDNHPKLSRLSSPDVDDDSNVEAPIQGDTTYEDTGICMGDDVEVLPPCSSDKLKSV